MKRAIKSVKPPSLLSQIATEKSKYLLARVWCDLNCWEWPDAFGQKLKPSWWDGHVLLNPREVSQRKYGFIHIVNSHIESIIPNSFIDKAWAEKTNRTPTPRRARKKKSK